MLCLMRNVLRRKHECSRLLDRGKHNQELSTFEREREFLFFRVASDLQQFISAFVEPSLDPPEEADARQKDATADRARICIVTAKDEREVVATEYLVQRVSTEPEFQARRDELLDAFMDIS